MDLWLDNSVIHTIQCAPGYERLLCCPWGLCGIPHWRQKKQIFQITQRCQPQEISKFWAFYCRTTFFTCLNITNLPHSWCITVGNLTLKLLGIQGQEQESKGGAKLRALSPCSCGPGSNPGIDTICGLSLLSVYYLAPRGFSPGTSVFPSPYKTTLPNFNSIWNAQTWFQWVLCNF